MEFDEIQFLDLFHEGDLSAAKSLLEAHPGVLHEQGYEAHSLLRTFVQQNEGHCYKASHLAIADLLVPAQVRYFRDAIIGDQLQNAERLLELDTELLHSEFTAGRGIAQGIHHWKSIAMGRMLVDRGASLDVLTTRGESALTMQLRFGTVEGVHMLLERGADPNHGSGGHIPSSSMNIVIELLLAHGWDIDNGQLLHDANHGHGSRVQTWLHFGADANLRNEHDQTALHLLAARGTGRAAIRALVDAGADIEATDRAGATPLSLARQASRQAAAQELLALGAQP